MLVRNKVRSMRSGEVLLVRATDPTTERDLNHFCQFLGHEMLEMTQQEGVFEFLDSKNRPMNAGQIINVFDRCFGERYLIRLCGGAEAAVHSRLWANNRPSCFPCRLCRVCVA